MTEEQQQESRSGRGQQLPLRQLLRITDRIQKFGLPKGMPITCLQGVSKSVGVEILLSTKKMCSYAINESQERTEIGIH